MTDVFFFEAFDEEEKALRRYLSRDLRAQFTSKTIQESKLKEIPAGIISIRTQSVIPKTWNRSLKAVFARSTGYDHILTARRESGLSAPCGCLADYCSRSVAEQAVLTVMALLRKLNLQQKHFNNFNRDGLTGLDIYGRNVLVVGVGHIGKNIVDIVRGLKANVRGVDAKQNVKDLLYVPLLDGVRWADVIVCAALLNKETDGMLNYEALRQAKKGCILVNVSRGEITPVPDLEKLMKEKILAGLGMDVFPDEARMAQALREKKKSAQNLVGGIQRLKKYDNVIFTPHNAFNTVDAVERKAKETIEGLQAFLKSGKFPSPVPEACLSGRQA